MQRKAVGLVIVVAVALIAFWLWQILKPSDIVEVQSRLLPAGGMSCVLCDLDSDGNDEIVVDTFSPSLFTEKLRRDVTAVTMRQGRFIAFPVPLKDLGTSLPKGRRLIGRTEKGSIAVAELQPNGEWQVEVLLPLQPFFVKTIGDVDLSGQDDDAFVLLGSNRERMLWFRRQPDGKWRKAGELTLPLSKSQRLSFAEPKSWGLLIYIDGQQIPLVFWDGRWHIGKVDEKVNDSLADWDGDRQNDRLIVRYLGDTATFLYRTSRDSRSRKQIYRFSGWKVIEVTATNELGDERWHLLLLVTKHNPPTTRLLDCQFEPSKGWQFNEMIRWRVPRIFDQAQLLVSDGRVWIVPQLKSKPPRREEAGVWRLFRTDSGWKSQFCSFPYRHNASFKVTTQKFGSRFWFYLRFWQVSAGVMIALMTSEVGFFSDDGRWRSEIQLQGYFISEWSDLNGDGYPELLALSERWFQSAQSFCIVHLKGGGGKQNCYHPHFTAIWLQP